MRSLGLYIHIPFCKSKCSYCNFYSFCADENEYERYTGTMISAIKRSAPLYQDRAVDTVYFGGGTPSVLGTNRLCDILGTIKAYFNIIQDAEITFEANPTSADRLDFEALYEAGFNRISFGLQSAKEDELMILNRHHTPADAKNVIDDAKKAGFSNISLDIMLAIPRQTKDSLRYTVDFCASCGVTHISAYILKLEPDTPLYRIKDSLQLPSDDDQALLYEYTVSLLEERDYCQYEISNFAKKGFQSRHNLKYWHDEEYLGLGPSAHSFIDDRRFYYPDSMDDFYENKIIREGPGGDRGEYLMLRLRLNEGVVFSEYRERFGENIDSAILKKASSLSEQKLVEISNEHLRLTVKGFLVSNSVIAYLLDNT